MSSFTRLFFIIGSIFVNKIFITINNKTFILINTCVSLSASSSSQRALICFNYHPCELYWLYHHQHRYRYQLYQLSSPQSSQHHHQHNLLYPIITFIIIIQHKCHYQHHHCLFWSPPCEHKHFHYVSD